MPTYEGLRLKILKYNRKMFGNIHRRSLQCTSFTIISNNCWGGETYEYYNLKKLSPTVGLFFMADDYIRFLKRIHDYLKAPLFFINPEQSKWRDWPQVSGDKRFGTYPIGKLCLEDEEVELFFLHYHSEEEAKAKWKRRIERINWSKILIKFNDQNGCREEHIKEFVSLPFKNKLFFTVKRWKEEEFYKRSLGDHYFRVSQLVSGDCITASHEVFGKYKNTSITDILNSL